MVADLPACSEASGTPIGCTASFSSAFSSNAPVTIGWAPRAAYAAARCPGTGLVL